MGRAASGHLQAHAQEQLVVGLVFEDGLPRHEEGLTGGGGIFAHLPSHLSHIKKRSLKGRERRLPLAAPGARKSSKAFLRMVICTALA